MRTTLVIDDRLVEEALKASGAKTKRGMVEMALKELIRKKNRELLRSELGTFNLQLPWEELQEMRRDG